MKVINLLCLVLRARNRKSHIINSFLSHLNSPPRSVHDGCCGCGGSCGGRGGGCPDGGGGGGAEGLESSVEVVEYVGESEEEGHRRGEGGASGPKRQQHQLGARLGRTLAQRGHDGLVPIKKDYF